MTYFVIGGHECYATNMYDCNGDDTTDVDQAVTIVGKALDRPGFITDYLESCIPITVH